MKRIIAVLLICALLTGCSSTAVPPVESTQPDPVQTVQPVQAEPLILDETVPEFTGMADAELLPYLEQAIYTDLLTNLDDEEYYVETVTTRYVSKEYLEECAYNSQENIYFGYSLAELNDIFQGERYVFTLSETGETTVEAFQVCEDTTNERILKNVAIGTGVILVCVTVAAITKNPAATATAGKTVKIIFTASSMGAEAGKVMALKGAFFGGATAAILEALKTGDVDEVLKASLLGASEGFKFGAIFGTAKGVADGIKIVGNSRFFPEGSAQAAKYPSGVEYTSGPGGNTYPRFEKYAKATATFDTPTVEAAANHTGLSGNYYWDAKLANAQCGYSQTPAGYVWHHVEDMKTMILVPQDLHSVAMGGMSHTGGASLIRAFLGL